MSVSVNQSEKFLSIDSPVAKTSSSVRADSPLDSQDKQSFRATFEEQRTVENISKDKTLKRNRQESLENKHKTSEMKQEKLSGSTAEHKNIQGSRSIERSEKTQASGAVGQMNNVDTSGVAREKLTAPEQNKESSGQLETNSDSLVESSSELVEAAVATVDEHREGENPVIVDTALAVGSEATTFIETAETAVIAMKSGHVLPLEGKSGELSKSSSPISSTLQGIEPLPASVNQVKAGSGATADLAGSEKIDLIARGGADYTVPSKNNVDSLVTQGKEINPSAANLDTSVMPKKQVVGISDTQARTASAETTTETKTETKTATRVAKDQSESPLLSATGEIKTPDNVNADFENKDLKSNTANLLSDGKAIASQTQTLGPQNSELQRPDVKILDQQSSGQGTQQEAPSAIANSIVSAEMKTIDESAIAAQTQKLSDGNIHSQSSATADKNLNTESKTQYLNGKTETTHFVNSQPTSAAVNANVPVDAGTANSRQAYTPDTAQVLDAQIKDVEKSSLAQGLEQSDSTDTPEINKNSIQAARWTQSIEQIQSLGKSTSLQTTIPSKFGGDQWANAVTDKVMWLSSQRIQSAEIRLDPPELGPMQVRVSVQQDQASVSFVSHHQSVREALDQNVFKLREQFGNEGLDLVDVSVSDHPSQQSMSNGGDSDFHGDDSSAPSIDKELTQETEVLELLNLVDHYV